MLQRSDCPDCNGTGVQMIQTSSMWGLIQRAVPAPCGTCGGAGHSTELPTCKKCNGRGLVGNESEICRSCNGTGHIDSFAMIPPQLLHPGTVFHRRCDQCSSDEFEIRSDIQHQKVYKTWDAAEELREYETVDNVKVSCTRCSNSYEIIIDPAFHKLLDHDTAQELQRLGLDLSFLYQLPAEQAAARELQQA
jgi:DnaJ-class molecular chaperone